MIINQLDNFIPQETKLYNNDILLLSVREFLQEGSLSLTFDDLITHNYTFNSRFKEIIVDSSLSSGDKIKSALAVFIAIQCKANGYSILSLPISYIVLKSLGFSFNTSSLQNLDISASDISKSAEIGKSIVCKINDIYTTNISFED